MTFAYAMNSGITYNYAEEWPRSYKETSKPLPEERARKLKNKKSALYTVLFGSDPVPRIPGRINQVPVQ